jgi:hypothetical protein
MPRRAILVAVIVAWTGCASIPTEFFRACTKDARGYYRVGSVVGKTEDGRYRFQPDDLPKDGLHVLIVPDCFGTFERPCVIRGCKLVAGTTAEGPLTEPPRTEPYE